MTSHADYLKLGDVAEFIRGITFKPEDVVPTGTPGSVPCMRTKNVQEEIDLSDVWSVDSRFVRRPGQYLETGDMLVSSANSWNLVGKCCWVPEVASGSTFGGFIAALRPNRHIVHPRYLFRWFSSEQIQATVRSFGRQTTNISNLDFARCLKLRVPLPSLGEQQRVALLLDSVDELRIKRRKAIALLGDLAQSIFLEMFGDPIVNPHNWRRVPIREIVSRIDSGKSPVCLDRPAQPGEWGTLKLSAVTGNTYRPEENKALLADARVDERNEVHVGDLLFTRKNTPALVGASVYVRETRTRLLLPDLIFRLVIDREDVVNKVYLHALLTYPLVRRKLQRLASGSASSMSNISKSKLMEFECELPPWELQQVFAARVDVLEDLKQGHFAHLAELDALFASLQHRAFRGELWDSPAA